MGCALAEARLAFSAKPSASASCRKPLGSGPHAAGFLNFPVGLRQQLLGLGFGLRCGGILDVGQAHQGNGYGKTSSHRSRRGNEKGGEAHLKILGVNGLAACVVVTVAQHSMLCLSLNPVGHDNSQKDEKKPASFATCGLFIYLDQSAICLGWPFFRVARDEDLAAVARLGE